MNEKVFTLVYIAMAETHSPHCLIVCSV